MSTLSDILSVLYRIFVIRVFFLIVFCTKNLNTINIGETLEDKNKVYFQRQKDIYLVSRTGNMKLFLYTYFIFSL